MNYPDAEFELLTAEKTKAFQADRVKMIENAGASTVEALDAQLTWWMVKDVFDRYPDLGAFQVHEAAQGPDDEGVSLAGLQVDVFAVGEEARLGKPQESLVGAQKELRDIAIGYGLVSAAGLVDLLETGGCDREGLGQWDWGQFGKGWVARRQELAMDAALVEPGPAAKPSHRF